MVNGLDCFKGYFSPYIDQYVLIGGVACSLLMAEAGLDFRSTKDLDIVLCVEALHANFVKAFWQFVEEGGYQKKQRSTSIPLVIQESVLATSSATAFETACIAQLVKLGTASASA